MPDTSTQTMSWSKVIQPKSCSNCSESLSGGGRTVATRRKLNAQVLDDRHYCSIECEKKMELFIFRACEASDERKRAFGERSANRLNPF